MDSDNLDFISKNYINEKTGKSIVTLRRYKGKDEVVVIPDGVEVLLSNPSYEIRGDFLVNIKHGITLFRLFFEDTTVRIPDGIKILGPNTFYELYQYSIYAEKMKPVEKVIIPASVEKNK